MVSHDHIELPMYVNAYYMHCGMYELHHDYNTYMNYGSRVKRD